MNENFSHLNERGEASMVDVGDKPVSRREARAEGFIRLEASTLAAIVEGEVPKGDVLAVARIAGIQAAKRTPEWIPLCHQLPLSKVEVSFEAVDGGLRIAGLARTTAQTGVEMEALTAVTAAALTVYDMCKAVDHSMVIEGISLLEKTKEAV